MVYDNYCKAIAVHLSSLTMLIDNAIISVDLFLYYCMYNASKFLDIGHPPGVPRRQPHHHSGLANLPSVGAVVPSHPILL